MDNQKTKKQSLEDRIAEARKDIEDKEEEHMGVPLEESDDTKRGKRAASEFLGLVMSGSLLGIVIDKYFGTAPLGMFSFIILGFVAAVLRANHITNKK